MSMSRVARAQDGYVSPRQADVVTVAEWARAFARTPAPRAG
jgi:hypothetical protein